MFVAWETLRKGGAIAQMRSIGEAGLWGDNEIRLDMLNLSYLWNPRWKYPVAGNYMGLNPGGSTWAPLT